MSGAGRREGSFSMSEVVDVLSGARYASLTPYPSRRLWSICGAELGRWPRESLPPVLVPLVATRIADTSGTTEAPRSHGFRNRSSHRQARGVRKPRHDPPAA